MPDVPGVTTGQIIVESWGDLVASEINLLRAFAATVYGRARATASATQTNVTSGAGYVPLALGAESYDVGGYHDNAVNNSRMTVPAGQAGAYAIGGRAIFAASASGTYRFIQLAVNGVAIMDGRFPFDAVQLAYMSLNGAFVLAVGDYVELRAAHDAGAVGTVLNVTSAALWLNRLP